MLLSDGNALVDYTPTKKVLELISDVTHSGKTSLTVHGWKVAFLVTCGAFLSIRALVTLCCDCPFIVTLPQLNVLTTLFHITEHPKHPGASVMCPIGYWCLVLIVLPAIRAAMCAPCSKNK